MTKSLQKLDSLIEQVLDEVNLTQVVHNVGKDIKGFDISNPNHVNTVGFLAGEKFASHADVVELRQKHLNHDPSNPESVKELDQAKEFALSRIKERHGAESPEFSKLQSKIEGFSSLTPDKIRDAQKLDKKISPPDVASEGKRGREYISSRKDAELGRAVEGGILSGITAKKQASRASSLAILRQLAYGAHGAIAKEVGPPASDPVLTPSTEPEDVAAATSLGKKFKKHLPEYVKAASEKFASDSASEARKKTLINRGIKAYEKVERAKSTIKPPTAPIPSAVALLNARYGNK